MSQIALSHDAQQASVSARARPLGLGWAYLDDCPVWRSQTTPVLRLPPELLRMRTVKDIKVNAFVFVYLTIALAYQNMCPIYDRSILVWFVVIQVSLGTSAGAYCDVIIGCAH